MWKRKEKKGDLKSFFGLLQPTFSSSFGTETGTRNTQRSNLVYERKTVQTETPSLSEEENTTGHTTDDSSQLARHGGRDRAVRYNDDIRAARKPAGITPLLPKDKQARTFATDPPPLEAGFLSLVSGLWAGVALRASRSASLHRVS